MKMTRRHVGKNVTWFGWDGKLYAATVESVRRGIAVLAYVVPSAGGIVRAYVDRNDQERINPAQA